MPHVGMPWMCRKRNTAAPKEKLLAAPGVSHGTIPKRPPQPFLQKKQQDVELGEKYFSQSHGGVRIGMEGTQKSRTVPGWSCFACSQEGAPGSCCSEERAGGRKERKIRQRSLLAAHRPLRELLQPHSQQQAGDRVEPALILCLSHVPWSPFPAHREPEGQTQDPAPLPGWPRDTPGTAPLSCLFKTQQGDSLLPLPGNASHCH